MIELLDRNWTLTRQERGRERLVTADERHPGLEHEAHAGTRKRETMILAPTVV